MNKNEKLSDIIGKCDDEFITKASVDATPIAKRRISIAPFAAAAACVCLVGGGVFAYSQSIKDKNPQAPASSENELIAQQDSSQNAIEIAPEDNSYTESYLSTRIDELYIYMAQLEEELIRCHAELAETEDETQQAELQDRISAIEEEISRVHAEIAECERQLQELMQSNIDIYQEPQWDDKTFYQQFPCFEFNNISYVAAGETYAEIGEKLGTATANNVDIYTGTDFNVELEIFEIVSVDSDYAVAVKALDGSYAAYTNCDYATATFGDMVEGLNLYQNLCFDSCGIQTETDMTVSYHYIEDIDDSIVWPLMYDCLGAESVGDYTEFSGEVFMDESDILDDYISFSVSSNVLGFENLSFRITKGGYITTNIISTGRAFYIGVDKANELAEYMKASESIQPSTSDDYYDSLARTVFTAVSTYITEYYENPRGKEKASSQYGIIGESDWTEGESGVCIAEAIDRFTDGEGNGIYWAVDCDEESAYAVYLYSDEGKTLIGQYPPDANHDEFEQSFWQANISEDTDVSIALPYGPINDSQSATLIAEFKETMGEAPLNLTTTQANSILQKISGLVLCKVDDVSEIEFSTGGGIIFEIVGGNRYNIIGENILCYNGAYYLIESDTTALISELTSLLGSAPSENSTESVSGVSTLVVASWDVYNADVNEGEIPEDAQFYELQLVDAEASDAPANPNNHSVIEVWYEPDASDKISYSFLGDSIVKIGDDYYRDLSGNADILKQAIADSIHNKQDYRHFEVVEFQKV